MRLILPQVLLLLSTWFTFSFAFAVNGALVASGASLVVRDEIKSVTLERRGYKSCRSKCSRRSCCKLPPSVSNDEPSEEISARDLQTRALFSYTQQSLDQDIVKRFTDNKVKLIFTSSSGSDDSTSAWKPISAANPRSRAFDLGLSALCGCTGLIVYSENGAYGAHFFEAAAWGLGDEAFQEHVVDFLQQGGSGLAAVADQLTKNDAAVAAYILTPQDEYADDDPLAPGYVPGVAMYGDQVQELVNLLPTIIPQLAGHIQVNMYQALEGGTEDGEDINPAEAALLDNTSRGRILFQYDPNNNGARTVRLFFEAALMFTRQLG